jgi:hypothetical protein
MLESHEPEIREMKESSSAGHLKISDSKLLTLNLKPRTHIFSHAQRVLASIGDENA